MSTLDLLRLAFGAIHRHRLRTGLSLLGLAIGVAAVVILTALGEGARSYVSGQFESLGSSLLIVLPGKTDTTGAIPGIGRAPNDLTLRDVEALRHGIPRVRSVVPLAVGNDTVSHRERRRQVVIVGSTPPFLEARGLELASGRFLPEIEEHRGAPVAVLGHAVARELFPGESPLGRVVRIGAERVRVIGVLRPRGVQLGMDFDEVVIAPVASVMRMFDRTSLFRVLVHVNAFEDLELVRARVLRILTERHGEEDVTVLTQDSVLGALTGILATLTFAVAGIAAISLAVAGIGIMNVMLVSVSERTAEIGLLCALGARRRQVLALFLAEAVMLAAAGGLLGLLASFLATRALRWRFPDFPIELPAWAVAAALSTSFAVGVLFGVLPARRASSLDPVRALSGR